MPTWESCSINGVPQIKCFEVVFANLISAITGLAAIAFFVMLVYGGFRFLTSGGNPKAMEGAQGTMTSAILGLAVIIIAWLILLLIGYFTGIDLTVFTININAGT